MPSMESPAESQTKSPAPYILRISTRFKNGKRYKWYFSGCDFNRTTLEELGRHFSQGEQPGTLWNRAPVFEICIDHPNGGYDIQPFARLSGTNVVRRIFDIKYSLLRRKAPARGGISSLSKVVGALRFWGAALPRRRGNLLPSSSFPSSPSASWALC